MDVVLNLRDLQSETLSKGLRFRIQCQYRGLDHVFLKFVTVDYGFRLHTEVAVESHFFLEAPELFPQCFDQLVSSFKLAIC